MTLTNKLRPGKSPIAEQKGGSPAAGKKMSLLEEQQRKLREDGFEKLKTAIRYQEVEQLDTPSVTSSESSTESKRFDRYRRELQRNRAASLSKGFKNVM